MKALLYFMSIISIFGLLIIIGCTGGTLSVDESYAVLKPVKQLELPEQVSENLIVKVSNVADEGSSYKNYLELFINGKKIQPNWAVSNVQRTYVYKLRLRPGYYKVRAKYYAYVGWGEEKYPIESQELVKVLPDKKTILTCDIQKEPNGVPVNKKMYFKKKIEPLSKAEKE